MINIISPIIYDYQKANISELNTLRKKSSTEYREKIDNVIEMYKDTKIPNFRTARYVAVN